MKNFILILAASLALAGCAKHAEDVTVTAKDGKDGVATTGAKGDKGDPGAPGASVKGDKGDKGDPGSPGAGTKGDKGDPGKAGVDGKSVTGPAGPAGPAGKGCTVVAVAGGVKFTCGDGSTATVTNTCSKGDKGDKGDPGPTGPAGKDGQCKECQDDFKPCGRDFDAQYHVRRDLYGKLYLVDRDGNVLQKLGIGSYTIHSLSCSKVCKITVDCNDRVEDDHGNSCAK